MNARTPFPEVIDNSIRSAFTQCAQKANLGYIEHWKPKSTSIHLHAGAAFAHGIETVRKEFYVNGKTPADALALGVEALIEKYSTEAFSDDETKSVGRMVGALDYYFQIWPVEHDFLVPYDLGNGHRAIEYSFSVPLPLMHPTTGNPLLYYGRFDMIGAHRDGNVFVVDEKTASALGQSWVDGWKLDAQFTGYCFGARQFGVPVSGAIIRGISILKTKYGHEQSIQARPQFMIDRWYAQLLRDIRRMIAMWQEGYFDHSYGAGCKMYGKCQFVDVCAAENQERWLHADFEQRVYQPWLEKSEVAK